METWENIKKTYNFDEIEENQQKLLAESITVDPKSPYYATIFRKYNKNALILTKRDQIEDLLEDLELYKIYEDNENIEKTTEKIQKALKEWSLELLFDGKYDDSNIYLTIHAGSGGTEAQDWAEMLLRMYKRWAEKHHFIVVGVNLLRGDAAGIKTATLHIKGDNLYGLLKHEHGVHRLVRVSPFDSKNRRHTSFAAVEVLPELQEIEMPPLNFDEIEIQTFRSGGPGGQYQNTTDSGCRLIHKPTGIVVESRQERSQSQNRRICEQMLGAKLLTLQEEKQKNEISELKGEDVEMSWGYAIRSYVFMPYQMVKDNRSNYETSNIQAILDGEIDDMLEANLWSESKID